MKSQIFGYLRKQGLTEPDEVNRLIVSAFTQINKTSAIKNEFLKQFIITTENTTEYKRLIDFIKVISNGLKKFGIEELIELFEFVVSPADRVITGAVYTPAYIRDFIVKQVLTTKKENIKNLKVCDVACGCGGFLYSVSKKIRQQTGLSYYEIYQSQIYGLDIQPYSVTRTKILLSMLAILDGEDREEFVFNVLEGDALTFNWDFVDSTFQGFDIIIGNPPYVCSRHLNAEIKTKLEKWEVCASGHPDLYIPFFQIGIENLAPSGILGFITMNSFFRSLNGRALRTYFQNQQLKFKIIDFGTEQVFKSRYTYTCICLIEKIHQSFIRYTKCPSTELNSKTGSIYRAYYSKLDAKKGWTLNNNTVIEKIEATGTSFSEIYRTRNGIATLKNDIYIFTPVKEDEQFYYLQNGSLYPIEKGICRDIINSNRLHRNNNLNEIKEKIIFPYDNQTKPKLLNEDTLKECYPCTYAYLKHKQKVLAQRDKGKGEYEQWFAFGRTQSLEKMKYKLLFPHLTNRIPYYIINTDDLLLFYNGLAVIGQSEEELTVIKKLMQSRLFWYYIENTSKPYTSGYFALSSNYIKNFGICDLNDNERQYVLTENHQDTLDSFFEDKYGVKELKGYQIDRQ